MIWRWYHLIPILAVLAFAETVIGLRVFGITL
jgi:hypothetical protein